MVQELHEESFSTHVERIGVVTLHPKMEFITKENMNIYLSYNVPSNKLEYMHNPTDIDISYENKPTLVSWVMDFFL